MSSLLKITFVTEAKLQKKKILSMSKESLERAKGCLKQRVLATTKA